jgi:hypothetical protein
MKNLLLMTLFLSSLSAGREGRETLYDRNSELKEARQNDCMRYLPAKRPINVSPSDDADEDEDDDDD